MGAGAATRLLRRPQALRVLAGTFPEFRLFLSVARHSRRTSWPQFENRILRGHVAEAPSKRSTSRLAGISLLACLLSDCGLVVRQATIAYFAVDAHFSPKAIKIEIDKSFIEQYKNRVTIRTVFTVDKAMGGPLPGALDGDLHFAGRAPQVALPLVAEIANASDQKAGAELVHRAEGTGKPLRISGVWRVWPEHAGS